MVEYYSIDYISVCLYISQLLYLVIWWWGFRVIPSLFSPFLFPFWCCCKLGCCHNWGCCTLGGYMYLVVLVHATLLSDQCFHIFWRIGLVFLDNMKFYFLFCSAKNRIQGPTQTRHFFTESPNCIAACPVYICNVPELFFFTCYSTFLWYGPFSPVWGGTWLVLIYISLWCWFTFHMTLICIFLSSKQCWPFFMYL